MFNTYEIENLRYELRKARDEIEQLKRNLYFEEDRHQQTKHECDEYKQRWNRSYDAYVIDPHEGYIPQEDVDELYELVDKYESHDIFIIEMRVQPLIFVYHRQLFTASEAEWQCVDHNRKPSNMAFIKKPSELDLPDINPGFETRCRHLLTGKVIFEKKESMSLDAELTIPDTDIPWTIYNPFPNTD